MDGQEGVGNKMKELREERIKKEEEKLLNKIHEQNKIAYINLQMEKQLQEIERQEKEKKQNKKNTLLKVVLAVVVIGIIALGYMYNEKEVSRCMEAGNNETFCRYAGE